MKKKNTFFIIIVVLIIAIAVGAWWWHNHPKPSDDSLANVVKRGVLIVGSDIPFGVMEFFGKDNEPEGIDVDIAREIATHLGVRLEFNDYDWDQLFSKVKTGEIDLAISSITITSERQKEMFFSKPYFNGGQVLVVRSDNNEIKGVNNLVGKKIAAQQDTTGYDEAKKCTQENLISTYLNFDGSGGTTNIIDDLRDAKVEVIIVDYIQALDMIKNYPGLKIVGVPFTKEDYGITTAIGNNSLIQEVDSILQNLEKSGMLEQIKTRWSSF